MPQLLQEFYVTLTRKIETGMSAEEALQWTVQLEAFPCVAIDTSLVKIAAEISERYEISYWDGAVVAAAESAGAKTLYSEELSDGQRYETVRVSNPFRDGGSGPHSAG
jgi:predicted nucleic acid-binding protein